MRDKKSPSLQRERELGVFSMMRFDSVTSSFLALLLTKSYIKTESAKIKKKVSIFRSENNQRHFLSLGVLSSNPSAGRIAG